MSITLIAIIWGVCSLLVMLGLGLVAPILFMDSEVGDHISRPWRILMVLFGPVTLTGIFLMVFPVTRMIIAAFHEVFLKK